MIKLTVAILLILIPAALCCAADAPKVINEIVYARVGDRALHMNLVLPAGPVKPRPAIIWIHGGGWYAGDYHEDMASAWGLSGMGYVTGSVEYRLSQEAQFPAQIHDCKAAIRFLRANAKQYGIDPDRIGIWGGSAGGHLVALLGTTGGIKALEGDEGNLGYSSRVQAVCDLFGPTNFTLADMKGYIPAVAKMIEDLLGGPVPQHLGLARLASPVEFASKDDPPFLILHGDQDPLVPLSQSEELYTVLKRVGADVKMVTVKHGGHGFAPTGTDPSLEDLKKMVREFFEQKLGKGR